MTKQEQQINIQTEKLYNDAIRQYYKAGIDVRKYPYLGREIRVVCYVVASCMFAHSDVIHSRLASIEKSILKLEGLQKQLERATNERQQLAKMLAKMQKSGGRSATASPPSWKGYVRSPSGITSMVLGGLLLLNLIF